MKTLHCLKTGREWIVEDDRDGYRTARLNGLKDFEIIPIGYDRPTIAESAARASSNR